MRHSVKKRPIMDRTYSCMNLRKEEKCMPSLVLASGSTTIPDMTASTAAIIDIVKSVMTWFEVYPLNIILTITIACYAFKFFGSGRRAAAGRS